MTGLPIPPGTGSSPSPLSRVASGDWAGGGGSPSALSRRNGGGDGEGASPPAQSPRPTRGGLVGNVLRLTLGNVGSRVLGLAREQVVAALFGTSVAASTFSAASRVPTMVYDLLIGGALSSALVPVFAEVAARQEAATARGEVPRPEDDLGTVAGAVLGVALAVLVPVAALLMVLAEPLMDVLGAGFAPEDRATATLLVRLAMPVIVLTGVAAVFQAILLARREMTRPAIAPATYNLGIIVGALALTPWLGVASLVVGMLAGAAAQVWVQRPGATTGLRLRVFTPGDRFGALRHPAVRRILRLYGPVAGGLLISAAGIALDTRLASQTGEGSLAAMRYATTVVQLPLGLVASALSGAVLPVLARYGRSGIRDAGFQDTLAGALAAAILMVAPLMVGAIVLRDPIVRLLFARGAFDEAGVALTTMALLWYAPQLPFVAIDQLLIAAFYAVQDTRVPVLAGVAGAVTFAAVAVVASPTMGMAGLVGANTVQHAAHATILAVILVRRGFAPGAGRLGAVVRAGIAAATMGAVIAAVQAGLPAPSGTSGLILHLMATGGAGMAAYAMTLAGLRGPEVAWVTGRIASLRHRSDARDG